MDDWRKPKAKAKAAANRLVRGGFSAAGRFLRKTRAEKETTAAEAVRFFGHRVGAGSACGMHEESRIVFRDVPPVFEEVHDLRYSENGMAWRDGQLVEKYSVQPIRVKDLLRAPSGDVQKIKSCAIVECDQVYSYGDWTHCYLGTILAADFPDVPVLIPAHLAKKGYVVRDLLNAGVKWLPCAGWTEIETAYVLRKRNPLLYWSREDAAAWRRAFKIAPKAPAPGSLAYLGRFDLAGETFHRAFPSSEVAAVTQSLGGEVIRQSDITSTTAPDHAARVETVIGDHGSGMFNIVFWQPRTVIELVVDDWWVNNTLFLAAGIGVENFAVLKVDGLSRDEIESMIGACLARFARARVSLQPG